MNHGGSTTLSLSVMDTVSLNAFLKFLYSIPRRKFAVSYNSGFKVVREKCSQTYNTSSAEEHIEAANYRRKHPVLSMQTKGGNGSIEHVFSKPNETSKRQTGKKHEAILSSKSSDLTADSSVQGNVSNFDVISSMAGSSHERGDAGLNPSLNCGSENSNDAGIGDMSLDGRDADKFTQKSTSNDTHSIISSPTVSASNRSRSSSIRSGSSRSQSSRSSSSDTGSNQSKSSRSRSNSLQRRGESIKSLERRPQSPSPSKRQQLNRSRSTESVFTASGNPTNDVHRPPLRKTPIETGKKTNSETEKFSNYTNTAESVESNVSVYKSKEKRCDSERIRASTYHLSRSRSIRRSGSRTSSHHSQPNRPQHLRSRSRSASTRTVRQTRNHDEENRGHRGQKSYQCAVNAKTKGRLSSDVERNRKSQRSRRRNSSDNSRSCSNHSRSRSHRKFSPYGSRRQSSDTEDVTSHRKKNTNNSRGSSSRDLINVVQNLTETLDKSIQQFKEYDRRLHRMELTVNKIFVLVGDLNGNAAPIHDEIENGHGFEIPNLPIKSTNELAVMKRKLKNKEFRDFFVSFCITLLHQNSKDCYFSSSTKEASVVQRKNPQTQ